MGVDCSIYSLHPETGEVVEHGLDRHSIFYDHDEDLEFPHVFITRADALLGIERLRAFHNKATSDGKRLSYAMHWFLEAERFIEAAPAECRFAVLSEHYDVSSAREKYADDLIRSQWPICSECSKKADNITRYDAQRNPHLFNAYCAHQCVDGTMPLSWSWTPENIPEWVLSSCFKPTMYGIDFANDVSMQ